MLFKVKFLYIFSLILFSCTESNLSSTDLSKQINLSDFGKEYSLSRILDKGGAVIIYSNDYQEKQAVKFYLSIDKKNIIDSIEFENLLLEPTVKKINPFFLKVVMPIRAGMGHFIEKTVLLGSYQKTLISSLNIVSREEINIGRDQEKYEVRIIVDSLNVQLEESFKAKQSGEVTDSFYLHTSLGFSDLHKVFYNNVSVDSVPMVLLSKYQYEMSGSIR